MKRLLMLAAVVLAFAGARGAARSPGPVAAGTSARLSFGKILSILMAPRWLRLPMLASALLSGRKAPPHR